MGLSDATQNTYSKLVFNQVVLGFIIEYTDPMNELIRGGYLPIYILSQKSGSSLENNQSLIKTSDFHFY